MAGKINLLNEGLVPKSSYVKFSRLLTSVNIIGLIVLFISSGAMIALILFNSRQISLAETRKKDLEKKIASLEKTETRLVLLKDRLEKIQSIYNLRIKDEKIMDLENIMSVPIDRIKVVEADLMFKEIKTTFEIPSSQALADLTDRLSASGRFKKIVIDAFEINQLAGYKVSFTLGY